jgi:hypothetical protein
MPLQFVLLLLLLLLSACVHRTLACGRMATEG